MSALNEQPGAGMGVREFLQSVVPWDSGGYVSIHWQYRGKKGFRGDSCQTIDAALQLITRIKAGVPANIYFCTSAQKLNGGHRDRENAIGLACVPFDIDIDPNDPKKYSSPSEAIVALLEFCIQLGIPRPSFFVASGGGLHVYWLSDRALPVEEWQPYADALKAAAKGAGLKFDAGVTGDAARVLRVPGTLNWKYDGGPRPVRLLQSKFCNGARHDFAAVFGKLLTGNARSPTFKIADAFKHLDPAAGLADEIGYDIPPQPFEPAIKEGCGWLREAYETGGKDYDNPQWHLMILLATFLKDGHELAHKLGYQYPTYTEQETDAKWDEKIRARADNPKLGWPQCKTIREAQPPGQPSVCDQCQHFKKGKSPLNLALEGAADKDMEELGGTRPPELRLPNGFCLNEEGLVCAIIHAKKIKGGIQAARLLPLLMTRITDPSLQFQNGLYGIGFTASTDRNNVQQVFLSSVNVCTAGLCPQLASRCVLPYPGKTAKEALEVFMVSWLKKLLDEDVAIRDSGTMGWRHDDDGNIVGFVYGDALHHEDGRTKRIVAGADDEFRKWYTPKGKRETWSKAARLLTNRKRPELDCLIAIGFASPLMKFTGATYGAILNFWGEPGTAKSTAQQVAAAVWGHPKQTRESLNSTPKSVQRRLGLTRNLAAYWDDIQDEKHQEALYQTMFVTAGGTEGGRLNPDTSMKERLDWQTMLVACSNRSFVEYLTRKQKSTTAGMRRIFEIEFNKQDHEPGMINALAAGDIFAALEHNYGVIGLEYARMLAREHKEIKILVSGIINEFTERVAGAGEESFWLASCGVLLAGAVLANRLGAELDVEAMRTLLIEAYYKNRETRGTEGTEGGSLANTKKSLAAFLNHYVGSGNVMFIDKLFFHKNVPIHSLCDPEKGHPIYVQVVRDQHLIIVSRRAMQDYFSKHEIQARGVFDGLAKYFNASDSQRTLGAGTVHAQAQERCFDIPVHDDQQGLYELLSAWGPPADGGRRPEGDILTAFGGSMS